MKKSITIILFFLILVSLTNAQLQTNLQDPGLTQESWRYHQDPSCGTSPNGIWTFVGVEVDGTPCTREVMTIDWDDLPNNKKAATITIDNTDNSKYCTDARNYFGIGAAFSYNDLVYITELEKFVIRAKVKINEETSACTSSGCNLCPSDYADHRGGWVALFIGVPMWDETNEKNLWMELVFYNTDQANYHDDPQILFYGNNPNEELYRILVTHPLVNKPLIGLGDEYYYEIDVLPIIRGVSWPAKTYDWPKVHMADGYVGVEIWGDAKANFTLSDFDVLYELKPAPDNYNPKGYHDDPSSNDCEVRGWTCDQDNFGQPLTVKFYEGSNQIAETIANGNRESAVGDACGGYNNRGFVYSFPESVLHDGQSHQITAKAVGVNTAGEETTELESLTLTPREVTCPLVKLTDPSLKYFGYYYGVGSYTGTENLQDIGQYSNTVFVSTINQLSTASNYGMKSIVILSGTFWSPDTYPDGKHILYSDWQDRWNQKWNELEPHLSKIRAFYPTDEPDITARSEDYELIVNAVKEKLDSASSDIPILMVVSYLAVPGIKDGSYTIPYNVDWLGFDEYGCWDDCYQGISITDKLDILIDVMGIRGKKVIVIPDGYKRDQTPPSELEQQTWVERNQNYFDLCTSKYECIAMLTFLWPSFHSDNLVGVNEMPVIENDLGRIGEIVKSNKIIDESYLGNLISQGKAVTASNTHSSASPNYVTDGNFVSAWNAGDTAPQWIELDLGKEMNVDAIRLFVTQSPSGLTNHQILVAGDSKQYTLVHEFKSNTDEGDLLQKTFYPSLKNIRHVKVSTIQSPSWVAWSEVRVFGQEPLPREDINQDGQVNMQDLTILLGAYGTTNIEYDLNNNGKVDIFDIVLLAKKMI